MAVARPQPAAAAGGVSQCTEQSLRAALAGGGLVTFSCSGTIPLMSRLEITQDTTIDGGGLVTLDGQRVTQLIEVGAGVTVELVGLTLPNGNGNSGNGGAIYNTGNLTLTASTLAGNSPMTGTGTLLTFTGVGATSTLTASILSGSNLCNGPITSSGYNVAGESSCGLTAAGDIQNVDPMLGTLATNGGPTETRMPLPGSPATDRVPNVVCVAVAAANNGRDQRGAPRPESYGLPCDSGAVELQVNSFFCVGERSGSLRYVSVPSGCVRGEFRLLPATSGIYAFCVGDRSGTMRYLPNSGTNCLRGEAKLTLPQLEPTTICVGERSRAVRYVEQGDCLRGELLYRVISPVG